MTDHQDFVRPPTRASTFPDERTAESALGDLFTRQQAVIEDWLTNSTDLRLRVEGDATTVVGREADPSGRVVDVTGVRAVLVRDASMPEGFRLLTGFPQSRPARTLPTDTAPTDTPALGHLMGAYLHQDFGEFGDIAENLDLFLVESPDLARTLPEEVAHVLAERATEPELEAFLEGLGCQVAPFEGEGGFRAWLLEFARRAGDS